MKIKNVGYNAWEIYKDDVAIARIDTFSGFRGNTKTVYVGEKRVADIRNQKEALEKLEQFFKDNKKEIEEKESLINQLDVGLTQVEHQVCIDALNKEKEILLKELEVLKSYDLV
jgi:hypothetical protein